MNAMAMPERLIRVLFVTALLAAGTAGAQGDAARGKKLFEQCAACHALDRGVQGVGPSLAGVFGRRAGELEDYRYSPPLKRSGIVWSPQTMDAFIADPQKEIRGNKMPFSGMPDARERADLIEYLRNAAM
jgi:cytochrome c